MSLQPGEQFGRYELVSWLGRGGMAETYRARLLGEAGVTKPVLIKKVLPEFINDEAFIAMFVSEARISATLSHGNIAQVYDFGRVDGDYFLAMEFVDGQPLHHLLKRARKQGMKTLPVPVAAFIAMEMCRGLHYAHTRTDEKGQGLGIVHRDISPDNVLVSYEGQVKIVDFGIAKARELRGFSTEPGIVKGKYLFFSPEQAQGEEVDARTDVWATGVVLYELLCGQLPVEDEAADVAMIRLIEGKFPRPRELNPSLPAELDAIVMEALALDRKDRYESCHAFGDALAGFLAATAPRFSAMSLSHFIQELFRAEITSAGRQVQVPGAFREQLAEWRGQSPTAMMTPARPRVQEGTATEPAPAASRREDVPTRVLPRKKSSLGVVLGGLTLVGALAGGFFVLKSMKPKAVVDPSNPQPLQLTEAPLAPPPKPVTAPEPPAPAATVVEAAPAPEEPPAVEETAPVLSKEEEEAKAAYDSATAFYGKKQYTQAVQAAERCTALTPEDAECHRLAGAALSGMGKFDRAVVHYRSFLELAPDHELAPQLRKSVQQYEQRKRRAPPGP